MELECETTRDVSRIERRDPTLTELNPHNCGLCSEYLNRKDISFIEGSPFLKSVVWSRKVESFPDLRYSMSLTHLDLRCNKIREINLEKCGAILKGLTLRGNPIHSLDGSLVNGSLEYLDAGSTLITDASALATITTLTHLELDNTLIEDTAFLSNMKSLTRLGFTRSKVSDASHISGLTNIRHLVLSHNPLTNFPSSLGMCHSLTFLDLSFTGLKSVPQLEGSLVTDLFLAGNHIEDISFVSGCPYLKVLDLSNNCVKDISLLKGNRSIVDLNVVSNDIASIECLRGNTTITSLKIGFIPIESLEPLSDNKTISYFSMVCRHYDFATDTFDMDMSPLLGNTSLMYTYFGYPCTISKQQRAAIDRLVKMNQINSNNRHLSLRRLSSPNKSM